MSAGREQMTEEAQRSYSDEEHRAFRAVSRREWGDHYKPGRGPAEFAGGDYWPDALEARAAEMESLVPIYRRAANALRREIASDNRCSPGSTAGGDQ